MSERQESYSATAPINSIVGASSGITLVVTPQWAEALRQAQTMLKRDGDVIVFRRNNGAIEVGCIIAFESCKKPY